MLRILVKVIDYTFAVLLYWGSLIILAYYVGSFLNMKGSILRFIIGVAILILSIETLKDHIFKYIPRIGVYLIASLEWYLIYLYLK